MTCVCVVIDDDNDLGSLCRRVPHSSSSASGVGLFGSTDNPNSSLYNNPNFPTLSISTEISSPLTTVNTSFDVSHPMVEPEAVSSIVSATDDYIEAPPLRSFMYNDLEWQVYMTEEGHEYFLEPKSLHSQWYDPLEYGYIEVSDYDGVLCLKSCVWLMCPICFAVCGDD